jgi:hypothetical protein
LITRPPVIRPAVHVHARVVEQDVERTFTLQDLARERAHLLEVAEIRPHAGERSVARNAPELLDEPLELGRAATVHDQVGPARGEVVRRLPADAIGCSSDQDRGHAGPYAGLHRLFRRSTLHSTPPRGCATMPA